MNDRHKRRLESHIMEILAELMARELRDPRVEGAVVTAVNLNHDYSVARVFVMGGEANVLIGLGKAAGFLRGSLGRYLKMKSAPELRFETDKSLDRYNRIDGILEDGQDDGESVED